MNHFTRLVFLFLLFLLFTPAKAQQIIELYPKENQNIKLNENSSKKQEKSGGLITKISSPTLEMFLPSANDSLSPALIICPGGGYSVIVYEGEGVSNAKKTPQCASGNAHLSGRKSWIHF